MMNYTKRIFAIVITIFSFQLLSAQNNYTVHTLKEGESLSVLAKEYNTSVGDIMRLNGMHADSKLVFGSKIKIPSTQKQVNVKTESNTSALQKPVITASANGAKHIVVKGETLYSISKQYNISIDQIKLWNHLVDDNAKTGTILIVGDNSKENMAANPTKKQRVETVTAIEKNNSPETNDITNKQYAESSFENKNIETQAEPQTENNSYSLVADKTILDYSGEGFFASQFKERKRKNMQCFSGISKTFKTASGWTDGKYYILANDIEPGTIVKISADNGNAVYAKVLWNMGDLKENAGINFRVSNATAAALRESNQSFNVDISF